VAALGGAAWLLGATAALVPACGVRMKITRLTIREYAESLAIAFILAMIIRHYAVEAFRIPTSSMEPTLIGDPVSGDRILVSKFQYDLHPPQRWDIVVFKIDEHRIAHHRDAPDPGTKTLPNGLIKRDGSADYINYVKRLVGRPGETIQIKNGDVFINGRICRKSREIEKVLRVPVLNDAEMARSGESWADAFDGFWTRTPGCVHALDGEIRLMGSSAPPTGCRATLKSTRIPDLVRTDEENTRIREQMESRGQRSIHAVTDLELGFRFRHLGGAGRLWVRLDENVIDREGFLQFGVQHWFYLPLGRPGEPARLVRIVDGRPEQIAAATVDLDLTREHTLRANNFDAAMALEIDGETIVQFESRDPQEIDAEHVPLFTDPTSGVSFGVEGCDVAAREIELWRDVFYTSAPSQQPWAIARPFRLADDEYFMLGDNSANSFDSRNWGVVKRRCLIGEAFFVFWPVTRWQLVN
jgi:signal peptidase I